MDTQMKSALALLALTGACFFLAVEAGFTAEQIELMASLRKNCIEETGVDAGKFMAFVDKIDEISSLENFHRTTFSELLKNLKIEFKIKFILKFIQTVNSNLISSKAGTIEACSKGTFAEDDKLKCYIKCTYQQMTVMDDDGVVDGDTLITMLPEELQEPATPVVNKCKDARGGDACGNAFAFSKCMYEAAPDKFVMI